MGKVKRSEAIYDIHGAHLLQTEAPRSQIQPPRASIYSRLVLPTPARAYNRTLPMDGMMGPPPDGGDQSRGPDVWAASLVTVLVATLLTSLRLATRAGVVRQFGWDDGTILLAWVRSLVSSISLERRC